MTRHDPRLSPRAAGGSAPYDTAPGRQPASELCGPSPTKRRTRAEVAAIDDAIIAAVAQDAPVTLRGVYYRVMSAGAIPKTEAAYKMIGRRLLLLRRSGRIDYRDITDGTRWVTRPDTYDSAEDALRATARLYRRSLWTSSPHRVAVFTEKDAITGTILGVTDRWDVPLGVMRGYASESFVWSFARSLDPRRHNVVAQLGDHDPSGVGAWDNFCDKVRGFISAEVSVDFVRLAVTPTQVDEFALPTRPTKRSDSRSAGWVGGSVEVDAIPAPVLRRLVDEFISGFVDADELAHLERVEAEERHMIGVLADGWGGAA